MVEIVAKARNFRRTGFQEDWRTHICKLDVLGFSIDVEEKGSVIRSVREVLIINFVRTGGVLNCQEVCFSNDLINEKNALAKYDGISDAPKKESK